MRGVSAPLFCCLFQNTFFMIISTFVFDLNFHQTMTYLTMSISRCVWYKITNTMSNIIKLVKYTLSCIDLWLRSIFLAKSRLCMLLFAVKDHVIPEIEILILTKKYSIPKHWVDEVLISMFSTCIAYLDYSVCVKLVYSQNTNGAGLNRVATLCTVWGLVASYGLDILKKTWYCRCN